MKNSRGPRPSLEAPEARPRGDAFLRSAAGQWSLRAAGALSPGAAQALRLLQDPTRRARPSRELLEARTDDGITLRIERVRPTADRRGTVLLQHGLSSNGAFFNLEQRSFARHLASLGFDCFIPDLRGARYSDQPDEPWGLDEYLEHDIPAVTRTVLDATGDDALSWVGHSMGGLLLFFYAMENEHLPVRRAVTLASAIDYRVGKCVYRHLRRWLPAAKGLAFLPYGHLARATASVAGRGPLLLPERLNFYRPNIEPELAAAVLRKGFHHIPVPLFRGLDTTFSEQGFSRARGKLRYLEHTHRYRVPTLFLSGTRDHHCSPEAVDNTSALLCGHPESQARHFGKAHGHAEDYGHFDLLIGRQAPTEVWPHITEWLTSE